MEKLSKIEKERVVKMSYHMTLASDEVLYGSDSKRKMYLSEWKWLVFIKKSKNIYKLVKISLSFQVKWIKIVSTFGKIRSDLVEKTVI